MSNMLRPVIGFNPLKHPLLLQPSKNNVVFKRNNSDGNYKLVRGNVRLMGIEPKHSGTELDINEPQSVEDSVLDAEPGKKNDSFDTPSQSDDNSNSDNNNNNNNVFPVRKMIGKIIAWTFHLRRAS
jgi:hypothetical protein